MRPLKKRLCVWEIKCYNNDNTQRKGEIGALKVVLVETGDGWTESNKGHCSSLYLIDQAAVCKHPVVAHTHTYCISAGW